MKLPTSSIVTACVLLHRPVQSVLFAMNDVHLRRFAFPEAQRTFVRSIKCHKRNIFLYIGRDIENCVCDFSSCALDAFTDYGHSYGTLLGSYSQYHILISNMDTLAKSWSRCRNLSQFLFLAGIFATLEKVRKRAWYQHDMWYQHFLTLHVRHAALYISTASCKKLA
ncbi:unnamed protein product [Ixodes pacificus]